MIAFILRSLRTTIGPALICGSLVAASGAWRVALVHAQASPPPAAPAVAEPPGYRDAIDAAIAEHEAGHFAESRALFARAHALFPNARSLRGLGMADFELRNYGASIDFLQQALSSSVKSLEGALRSETEQLLARARGFVGRYRLTLQPLDAAVVLDGALLAPADTSLLVLAVGDHALDVSAKGYVSERRTLRVTGGEDEALRFELPLQAAVTPLPATSAIPAPSDSSSSLLASPWLWAAVGVVAVGAAVGIGLAASGGGTSHEAAANSGTGGIVLRGP